ncbi:MAG: Clp protease N-terminal domain-containing protein [Chloroflexota bacterium]
MSNYSRYSHHARRALTHAGLLVQQFHHPRINTGHVLVGVMLTKGSIGHAVLTDLNLHARDAIPLLESLVLPTDQPPEHPANDAAVDVALNLATDEATWLGHHYIGTEHLLLGITRTNVGNASDLLHQLSVSPDRVRHRVRIALDHGMMEPNLNFARRSARLSELSRRVINGAEQLAVSRDDPAVGLGHLLLMLLGEWRSITARLLSDAGVTPEIVRGALERQEAQALYSIESIMIEASEEARSMGHHFTGTEHLLLALVRDPFGSALLERLEVEVDRLKQQITNQLSSPR